MLTNEAELYAMDRNHISKEYVLEPNSFSGPGVELMDIEIFQIEGFHKKYIISNSQCKTMESYIFLTEFNELYSLLKI